MKKFKLTFLLTNMPLVTQIYVQINLSYPLSQFVSTEIVSTEIFAADRSIIVEIE
jgi:hypothetical protein